MTLKWLKRLEAHVEESPLTVFRFSESEWDAICESMRGPQEFSFARPHTDVANAARRSLCIISPPKEGLLLGLIHSRSPVTTLESRVKIKHAAQIPVRTEPELIELLTDERHSRTLAERLAENSSTIRLSPKLSSHVITRLAEDPEAKSKLRFLSKQIRQSRTQSSMRAQQADAVKTALEIFGLRDNALANSIEVAAESPSSLDSLSVIEDRVIEHDARSIPGYTLCKSDLTGRAVFENDKERLEVFTANRGPLEKCFGVDLIYLNVTCRNLVMLQYKMLDREGDTWVYRPDEQIATEIERMRLFDGRCASDDADYRFNRGVFFLKFVKRQTSAGKAAVILPLEHYDRLVADGALAGPRGGVRVDYDALGGTYLRGVAFVSLVRSGYIGSGSGTTDHLRDLIEEILRGNRAVVAAIQTAHSERKA